MSDGESKFGDLLGIAPVSRAVERVTDSVMSGAEAILGRVCLPAAEELGLLFRDKVSAWRQRNLLRPLRRLEIDWRQRPRTIVTLTRDCLWKA
jgi:hypothetical protein